MTHPLTIVAIWASICVVGLAATVLMVVRALWTLNP